MFWTDLSGIEQTVRVQCPLYLLHQCNRAFPKFFRQVLSFPDTNPVLACAYDQCLQLLNPKNAFQFLLTGAIESDGAFYHSLCCTLSSRQLLIVEDQYLRVEIS
jgi:hypothetical protein